MRYVDLHEELIPHIRLFENGTAQNTITGKMLNTALGNIEITSMITNERVRKKTSHLVGKYFLSPWMQFPQIQSANLSQLGYSSYCVTVTGQMFSLKRYEYLTGGRTTDGYFNVCMMNDYGGQDTLLVHRMVAMMFIPNHEGRPEVNHKDGDKDNNHVLNLEWVYPHENTEHALKTGLRASAMDDSTIHAICAQLQLGLGVMEISRILNVEKHSVLSIKSGCHARIANQYAFERNQHF